MNRGWLTEPGGRAKLDVQLLYQGNGLFPCEK